MSDGNLLRRRLLQITGAVGALGSAGCLDFLDDDDDGDPTPPKNIDVDENDTVSTPDGDDSGDEDDDSPPEDPSIADTLVPDGPFDVGEPVEIRIAVKNPDFVSVDVGVAYAVNEDMGSLSWHDRLNEEKVEDIVGAEKDQFFYKAEIPNGQCGVVEWTAGIEWGDGNVEANPIESYEVHPTTDPAFVKIDRDPNTPEVGEDVTVTVELNDTSCDPESVTLAGDVAGNEFDIAMDRVDDMVYEDTIESSSNPADRGDMAKYHILVDYHLSEYDLDSRELDFSDQLEFPEEAECIGDSYQTEVSSHYKYWYFDNVKNVGVIWGRIPTNGQELAPIFGDYSVSDIVDDSVDKSGLLEPLQVNQKRIEEAVNEYLASWKGLWGTQGYDFTHIDNSGKWLYTDSPDNVIQYHYPSGRDLFKDEAIDIARDEYNTAGIDVYVAVNAGYKIPWYDNFCQPPSLRHLNRARFWPTPAAIYIREGEDIGTWVHELCHDLGLMDFYYRELDTLEDFGENYWTSIMGRSDTILPISSVNRTNLYSYYNDSHGTDRPWLETEMYKFPQDRIEVPAANSEDYGPGNTVPVLNSRTSSTHPKLVFEARNPERGRFDGVFIYMIDETPVPEPWSGTRRITELLVSAEYNSIIKESGDNDRYNVPSLGRLQENVEGDPIIRDDSDRETRTSIQITDSDFFATISLDEQPVDISYPANVNIKSGDSNQTSVTVSNFTITGRNSESSDPPEDREIPDLRLHAYDQNGKHVGLNYESGEYERQIEGSNRENTPGNMAFREWIAISGEKDGVTYSIDSQGVEEYLDWLGEMSKSDGIGMKVKLDRYKPDAQINPETGEVENVITVSEKITVEPGVLQESVVPATIEHFPRSLQSSSKGRWIQTTVELESDEVSVNDIDITTVKLDGSISALSEGYGFTKKPVAGNKLRLRFDRQSVINTLGSGNEKLVIITGKTDDGRIFIGETSVNIIGRENAGNESERNNSNDETRSENKGEESSGDRNESHGENGSPGYRDENADGGTDNSERKGNDRGNPNN